SHIDLKATILDLLGVAGDDGDGVSLGALLRGETKMARETIWAEYHPRVVPEQYNQTLITPDWRITLYTQRPDWGEMFDRRADRDENRNLFHDPEYRRLLEELRERLPRRVPAAPDAGAQRPPTD